MNELADATLAAPAAPVDATAALAAVPAAPQAPAAPVALPSPLDAVQAGQLPAGALLPATERVAVELAIEPVDVQAAYSRLLADGVLEQRADGALCIASHGEEASIGDATQVRFEAALIKAVREAPAKGNVVDLMDALKKSLNAKNPAGEGGTATVRKFPKKKAARK